MIPDFLMLVGLPGSGKSTYIKNHFNQNLHVHSSDAIREELSGDVNNQDINKQVFDLLHKRIKDDLRNGISCVYDATNINWKRRKAFLDELKSIPCWKTCHVIATPYDVCLTQNSNRDRVVPEYVIERMYRNFDIPYFYEGWDGIEIVFNDNSYSSLYGEPSDFIASVDDYDQMSKWHSETLGQHCLTAADIVLRKNGYDVDAELIAPLYEAALLHDCGKPFTQTFKDSRGNSSDTAHYYDHEHVGSYNSLFYDSYSNKKLLIAVLIRWHMQMHFMNKKDQQHTIDKYKKLFGEPLWSLLCVLYEGDKSAH